MMIPEENLSVHMGSVLAIRTSSRNNGQVSFSPGTLSSYVHPLGNVTAGLLFQSETLIVTIG